jgi:cyclopropane fatty-acyl-phospholipid synthase-like methyltransferase
VRNSRKYFEHSNSKMKIFPKLSTAMKFITPAQYSKSNQAHYVINTSAVNDFTKVHPQLGENDHLLDFGCGTGETTVAMAEGILGNLGKPNKVKSRFESKGNLTDA